MAGDLLGASSFDKDTSTIVVGAVLVVTAAIAIGLVKRCPRKNLLVMSAIGVSASLFTLGMYFYLKEKGMAAGLDWVPIVTLVSYICFFVVR